MLGPDYTVERASVRDETAQINISGFNNVTG